jgi:alpha-glucoside transport system permease protein
MIGRNRWAPLVWLSPALVMLGVFLVYPSIDTIRRSLLDARSQSWVGLDNYRFILDNPQPLSADTHSALLNNILWLVLFPATIVVIGLVFAVLMDRVRYESLARSLVFVPMAISFVAAAVIWKFMYEFDPNVGTFNAIVTGLGGHATAWLQDTHGLQTWFTSAGPDVWVKPLQINNAALITVGIWMWTGFGVVVFAAALKGIPAELLEAARVDGANEWQVFWRIMIPSIRPTIVVVATTLLIQSLKIFDLIFVMTGGRFYTDVVATLFYRESFVFQDFGVGAALAVILLIAVVPGLVLGIRRFQLEDQ